MKKCCFIVPYFGRFPNYFPLFVKTCSYNTDFNWLIITDNEEDYDYPENIRVVKMSFREVQCLFQSKFNFKIALERPYKLCDFKPAYGYIFEEYLSGFISWGHCDIDTLMGDLSSFITEEMLIRYDKLFCLGHMTIYKNTYDNNRAFMSYYNDKLLYKDVFSTGNICWFDEEYKDANNVNELFLSLGKQVFSIDYSMNCNVLPTKFVLTKYLGLKNYPYNHGYKVESYRPAIYTWEAGHIFRYYVFNNRIVKEEFLYAHFMRRKMGVDYSVLGFNKIKIIPNRFEQLEVSSISMENFQKIKKNSPNLHLFYVKILPKIKKIIRFQKSFCY